MGKILDTVNDLITKEMRACTKLKGKELEIEKIIVESLKLIKSELTTAELRGKKLTDAEEEKIILKMISQREESIKIYENNKRFDLVEKETRELEVIKKFAPEEVSEEDLECYVLFAISSHVASKEPNYALSMKDLGDVIKFVKTKFPNADGNFIRKTFEKALKSKK